MAHNYWTRTLRKRLGRRRFIAATGGMTAGAALLAACGGDDDDDAGGATTGDGTGGGAATGPASSGLLTEPVDTSSQARHGGILKRSMSIDLPSMNPYQGRAPGSVVHPWVYEKLLTYKPGHLEPSKDEVIGEAAESWEWAPDGLSFTMRLREGMTFHPVEPTNGRPVDIEDVLAGFTIFSEDDSDRTVILNEINPRAPVMSFTATDSRTIRVELSEPLVHIPAMLSQTGPYIMPKEALNDGIDLRLTMVGSGPFYMDEYQPSLGYTFKRHPEYWDPEGRPYVDQIDMPIIPEYATGLAQFRSGGLYDYPIRPEESIPLKKELTELSLYDNGLTFDEHRLIFGYHGDEPAVRDERVRQGISMSYDRALWIDAEHGAADYEAEGLPVNRRWNTSLLIAYDPFLDGWWLDPQDEASFGENARFYQHNLAEAKKLFSAAGFPDGPEITFNHMTTQQPWGPNFPRWVEISKGMLTEGGVKINDNPVPNEQPYREQYAHNEGNFTGITVKGGPHAPTTDPIDQFYLACVPWGGVHWLGFDVNGTGDNSGDPELLSMLDAGRTERDVEARKAIVNDVQRYLAPKQYMVNWPGGASQFIPVWPIIQNFRVYESGGGGIQSNLYNKVAHMTWWLDDTKPPEGDG